MSHVPGSEGANPVADRQSLMDAAVTKSSLQRRSPAHAGPVGELVSIRLGVRVRVTSNRIGA